VGALPMSMSCIAASALVTVVLPADQWTGCSNNGLAVNAGSVVVSGGIDETVIDGERPDEIDDESATSTPAASSMSSSHGCCLRPVQRRADESGGYPQ